MKTMYETLREYNNKLRVQHKNKINNMLNKEGFCVSSILTLFRGV